MSRCTRPTTPLGSTKFFWEGCHDAPDALVLYCAQAPPPFTIGDLRRAIPKHCFKRELSKSFGYLVRCQRFEALPSGN